MFFSVVDWWYQRRLESQLRHWREVCAVQRIVNPYHAVGIKGGSGACARVAQLKGRRFLSREAPRMPVEGCDAETCSCIYAHFDDRRSGGDRRMRPGAPLIERRAGQGRRQTDG